MGILIDILIVAAIGGYAGYLIWRIVSSMRAGKGNPYSCTRDCSKCTGACGSAMPDEKSIRRAMKKAERAAKKA